jgi:hypothetical protein
MKEVEMVHLGISLFNQNEYTISDFSALHRDFNQLMSRGSYSIRNIIQRICGHWLVQCQR